MEQLDNYSQILQATRRTITKIQNVISSIDQDAVIAIHELEASESVSPSNKPPTSESSVEEMIEHSMSCLNCTQILQAILASIPCFFDSQQSFISIFAHAQPKWHCNNNNNSSSCKPSSNICNLSKTEWAWESGISTYTSIISEWDLQCASWFIIGLPTVCFFIGSVLGGLSLATLGDSSLGRKNLLCGSCLFMSITALGSSFSPNLLVYSILRFLSGIGRSSITVSALTLVSERVGKQWRGLGVMILLIIHSIGLLALTGIAYAIRSMSWRSIYLSTSIPGIICSIICYFFLFESPRWLFLQGREIDAVIVLRRIGSISESQILPSSTPPKTLVPQKVSNYTNPFVSLNLLFTKGWAVKRLLAAMIVGFGTGLMYFGMFLSVGNFGFSIYLASMFSSLLSLSTYLLTFLFWNQRCNRRGSLLGFSIIGGALSIAFSILNEDYKEIIIGLELTSLFSTCMAYNVMLSYMVELFPTCVRNSALSLVRQAVNLGSLFDPMLIVLGKNNKMYTYGAFGFVIILSGLFVLCLPETRGKALCDTMEEEELKNKN